MALVLADRVQDLTSTTGTGTITLTGTPPEGYQSFGAAIGNGNTTYYTITGGSQWEVGIGTYTAAGTSLSRDTVLSSSNGGALVNFSAGDKTVFVTYPAEKSVNEDAAGNVNISVTGNAATATQATNLAAGAAGSVPYQTAANTTAFLASASGVLVGGNPPTFSTTPTLTGTNFSAIPNAALSNNAVTIGTTAVALGATSTTLAGLTSVTLTQDPTANLEAATKQYVDAQVSAGIHFHQPVRVESPINLNATYSNGTAGVGATLTNAGAQTALVIDGVTLSVADRVLIFQQTTQTQNGIYVVTTVGSGATNWVLTRSSDADTYVIASPDGLSEGSTVFVQQGTTGAGGTYTCNTPGTITFGTTNITFAQVSSAQIYSAGTGLTLTGTVFSLTTPVATTLGGTGLTTFGASNRAIFSSGTNTLTAGTLPVAAGGTGQTTYVNGELLIGKTSDGSLAKATLTSSTGISISNGDGSITITNTAPDQTVSLTGSGTTTITGSYPNFNIASADQFVGTVTSVSASVDTTGTDIAVAVTSSTTTPAIALSIPTSSASARGALTSTDWSTFNAKQVALVSGTNIKTINGTSVLGSGDIVTPAGGSQTFTSSGAITAGNPIAFKSAGVVEAITQVDTNAVTSGPVSPVASTYGEFILPSSVYDAANNRYIMAYVNASGVGFVVAGVITNGTLSWGTSVSLGSSTCYGVGLAYSVAQSQVVLAYNINSTLSVASLAGTGTTVSLNTATTLTTSNSSNIQPFAICYSAANSNVSILYYQAASNILVGTALTPSGSTISAGSANTLLSSYSQYGVRDFRLAPNTSGNTLLFLSLSSDRGTMRGINIYPSGTSFSNGSVFNPVNFGVYNAISLGSVSVEPRGGYFVFSWARNYDDGSGTRQQMSSISIGGSSVQNTINTTSTVGYSSSNPANLAFFYDATANLTRTFTINQNNGLYSIGNVITDGSGTISFSVGTGLFSPGVSSGNKTGVFNSNGSWFTSNTPLGSAINAWSFTPATSTSNFLNYIGISTQTVTNGQSVVVTTGGGVNTNVSGLTAGLTYVVSPTGAFLASDTNFPRAGRALTTTSILVEDRAALTAATKTWTQITSTSTYTVPSGKSSVRVYAFGGGGNGVQGTYDGSGGGGGGCAFGDLAVVPGQTLSISISSKNVTITRSGVTLFTADAGTNATSSPSTTGVGGSATISGLVSNGGAYSGGNGSASGGGGGSSGSPLGDGKNGGISSGGGGGWGGAGSGGGSGGNGSGGGGGGVGGSGSLGGGGSGGNASGHLGGAPRSPFTAFTDPLLVGVSSEGANGGPFGASAGNGGGGSGQGQRTDNGAGYGGSGGFGGGGGGATASSGSSTGGSGGFGGGGGGCYNNFTTAQGGSGGFGGGGGGAASQGSANGGSGGNAIVLIYA